MRTCRETKRIGQLLACCLFLLPVSPLLSRAGVTPFAPSWCVGVEGSPVPEVVAPEQPARCRSPYQSLSLQTGSQGQLISVPPMLALSGELLLPAQQ